MSITPLLSAGILNEMRQHMYGRGASLSFYRITPTAGEVQIATLNADWHVWRSTGDPPAAITIVVARSANIEIAQLLENAAVDLVINGQTKRYRVVGLTEHQQLGAGWVIHAEPLANTI